MLRLSLKKIRNKSQVARSISEGRIDQKQIFNFVRPNMGLRLRIMLDAPVYVLQRRITRSDYNFSCIPCVGGSKCCAGV